MLRAQGLGLSWPRSTALVSAILALLLAAVGAPRAQMWPDYSFISIHFQQGGSQAWNGSGDITHGGQDNVITLSGSGGKSIVVKAWKDGATVHDDYISYWIKYYIEYGGTGFGGMTNPPVSSYFSLSGWDNPASIVPIDNAEAYGGPYGVDASQTYPASSVLYTASSLYLTTHQWARVNYMRPIPEPGAILLLGIGLAGLAGSWLRGKRRRHRT